ncbi:hypothetical protein D9M69_332150 [compost metagenome]
MGSPSRLSMEPETSTRNTRLAGGNWSTLRSEALIATRSRRVCGFQGVCASSMPIPKGTSPSGSG